MYGALDISTSGMVAQRIRLEVASANLANASTLFDESGRLSPYQRRFAVFSPGNPQSGTSGGKDFGVQVKAILTDRQTPPNVREYDPDHPLAYKDGPYKGYIAETNVNSVEENINALEAMRAYEANVMAAEATKQMISSSLRLLA